MTNGYIKAIDEKLKAAKTAREEMNQSILFDLARLPGKQMIFEDSDWRKLFIVNDEVMLEDASCNSMKLSNAPDWILIEMAKKFV